MKFRARNVPIRKRDRDEFGVNVDLDEVTRTTINKHVGYQVIGGEYCYCGSGPMAVVEGMNIAACMFNCATNGEVLHALTVMSCF